jgi:hypothetical protein
MTYKEGDLLVEEYLDKTDNDQLYEVEEIIDERRWGKVREFRVKWKVRLSHSTSGCYQILDLFLLLIYVLCENASVCSASLLAWCGGYRLE